MLCTGLYHNHLLKTAIYYNPQTTQLKIYQLMKKIAFILLTVIIASCTQSTDNTTVREIEDLTVYVDPFIGTGEHGHTFPGATRPFGMVQVSPINGTGGWDWVSGYHYSDSVMIGFGHLHLSGTGIGDLLDLLVMPASKEMDLTIETQNRDKSPYKSSYSHDNETASPGYYQVYLETPKVNAEVTSTLRTGYHKYTFDEDETQSLIMDLGFALNWDRPLETAITVENNNTISGYRHSTGWAKNQKLFFVAEFSKPLTSYNLYENHKLVEGASVAANKTAAQFFFDPEDDNTLQFKLALSSVSIENAKENLDNPGTINFDEIRTASRNTWQEALAKIEVQTPIDSLKTIFYTSLYHAQIAPVTFSDKNGQFRLQNDEIVQATDYTAYSTLSLWDTFRAEHPLLTILKPELTSDVVNSMLAYYQESGSLPVWTLYGNETNTMTGYHSIPVIAEAYQKGIRDYDVEKVYQAMKATMMQDARGLKEYKEYGYLPHDKMDESVTITLEYAYNDWCVAQMAKALDKEEDYQYFSKRAEAWKHLLDAESGFMRGKSSDGKSWNEPFDPKHSNHREHTDYTEGNAWQHSWFVLHDTDEFINMHGGVEPFTHHLEQLFAESSEITGDNLSPDISGLIGQYAHGNEPSHHIAFLFNRAGQPWRTQYWTREILTSQYSTKPEGISGNEDAGQISAWYVLASLGIYSFNPASGEYEITSPMFETSNIQLPNGKTFTIKANNVSMENRYIQSATLNGQAYNKSSITHATILEGGELVFEMGREPNKGNKN